jgi:hypothetical protein
MLQRYAFAALLACLSVGMAKADDQSTKTSLTVPTIKQVTESVDQSLSRTKTAPKIDTETFTQGQALRK